MLYERVRNTLIDLTSWARTLFSGKPHFVIGSASNPYLFRWFLIPRNSIVNIYLHKFLRDDDDRALHDHPWWFMSLLLAGTYKEVLLDTYRCPRCGNDTWCDNGRYKHPDNCPACGEAQYIESDWRRRFSITRHHAEYRHRVVLARTRDGKPIPCWTIVITGPRIRSWGFWCPRGFVGWKEFTKPNNSGEVGRGCE